MLKHSLVSVFCLIAVHSTSSIDPIPDEDRTDPKLFQLFFVWFSANMNVLG